MSFRLSIFLFLSIVAFPLHAVERVTAHVNLGVSPSKNIDAFILNENQVDGVSLGSDTFSLAPLVQDAGEAFFMSDAAGPTLHTFDGSNESGGMNVYGTEGGFFIVLETVEAMGGGVDRVIVEVRAVNAISEAEPWVDISNAGTGLESWRLDVGSTLGGTDPIHPDTPFTLVGSGTFLFNSALELVGSLALNTDTSDATSLSGVAVLGIGGADIAGFDLAAIQIYWDIMPEAGDLALQLIDVPGGTYGPGDTISIHNKTENIGSVSSPTYNIDFYASLDTDITDSDVHLAGFSNDALGVGEVDEFVDNVSLPGNLPNDTWFIGGILTVSDSDPSNNTNYDMEPITVSTDPDIRIRPLNLTFEEMAKASPPAVKAQTAMAMTAAQYTQIILPDLRNKALSSGHVRLLVGLKTGFQPEGKLTMVQAQDQRAAIASTGDNLVASLQNTDANIKYQYETIPYMALTVDASTLDFLAASPLVDNISEDSVDKPYMASSNMVIGSSLAWAEGLDGAGWAVAVLDTGVDNTHSWFTTGSNKVISEACYGTNVAMEIESFCPGGAESSTAADSGLNCDLAIDGCDHGTHVAGTAAGNDATGPNYGVARGADIVAIQVFSKFLTEKDCGVGDAPCTLTFGSDQIAALERVLVLSGGMNIAAVNMSLGGGSYSDQTTCDAANAARKAAIDNLRAVGVATVIAAGNDGFVDSIGAPGCISSAISIGATVDNDEVAVFSNIYPQIHLLAPGVDIDSSVPGNGLGNKAGTSMATPHVAGAWAVMKQRSPAASVDDVVTDFENTSTPVDDLRPGGIETDMHRINLDLAIGEPRTTFGIFNDGPGVLTISSITAETSAPWISWMPEAPFDVQPDQLQVVSVAIDFPSAPGGESQTRLLINSNDPDESPFPGGIFVNVTALGNAEPEFDSTPAAGTTLVFGDQLEQVDSTPMIVQVDNLGNADLTLACSLTGANPSSFNLNACPTPIAGGGSDNISVSCEPESLGAKAATLEVTSNDADETNISYNLTCTGIESLPEIMHSDGFES